MIRRNPNREDGWVLMSAIVLMAIMLSVGLSAYAFVDTGQTRARESRERESSLSLAEAALYAQGFALAKNWPNANKQLGGDCSSANPLTATTQYCPDRDTLAKGSSSNPGVAQFSTTDFGANATWTTSVRDNYGALASAYDPAVANSTLTENGVSCPQTPCRMDFNGDRQLWVQARAVVRGKPRNIVARLKLEQLRESVPQASHVRQRPHHLARLLPGAVLRRHPDGHRRLGQEGHDVVYREREVGSHGDRAHRRAEPPIARSGVGRLRRAGRGVSSCRTAGGGSRRAGRVSRTGRSTCRPGSRSDAR